MITLKKFFERFDIEIRTNYQNSQRWFVLFDKEAKDYVKEPSQYSNRKVIKQFLKSEDIYNYLKTVSEPANATHTIWARISMTTKVSEEEYARLAQLAAEKGDTIPIDGETLENFQNYAEMDEDSYIPCGPFDNEWINNEQGGLN